MRKTTGISSQPQSHSTKKNVFIVALILLVGVILMARTDSGIEEGENSNIRPNSSPNQSNPAGDSTLIAEVASKEKDEHDGIDFIVAGFPKCGTSTLMYAFAEHDETEMPESEYCDLGRRDRSDAEVIAAFHKKMDIFYGQKSNASKKSFKRGLKCPKSVRFARTMERLEFLNPETRVIIGVRHPVLFFQSYYNYRVVSQNTEKSLIGIPCPDPYSLIGGHGKAWRGVFTDMAKYEESLMQLSKVDLNTDDMKQMVLQELMLVPNSLRMFLYDVEQLSDPDENRATRFRSDMQHFLGLRKPIAPFGQRNVVANKGTYPETINICDDKYKDLRATLLKHAEKTRHWIRDKFIKSDDVMVGGDEQHFLEILAKWGEDPCP